ncbi:MAG: hypothetical protein FWH11_01210 [Micrococcales bacterium]|nr:hypothetical protein [Micrococcales bacterium]
MAGVGVRLSWSGCDARTGQVLVELPDLQCSRVSSLIAATTTTQASLPVWDQTPPGWVAATKPWASVLVLSATDDDATVPLWAGMVTRRRRGLGSAVELSLSSAEAHLDRVYVPDLDLADQPQTTIAARLGQVMVRPGSPWQVDAGTSAVRRDRHYRDASDATVGDRLGELSSVQGGPEWVVTWRRTTDPVRYVPVLVVRDRVGASRLAGLRPATVFEAPGPVVAADLVEDYGQGYGATTCTAVSTGVDEEDRPQASRSVAVTDRLPAEYRWCPSTSITSVATLAQHASRALQSVAEGTVSLTMTANLDAAPRLGVDWSLGDEVGYVVQPGVFPAFPDGLSGVSRAVGWEVDLTGARTITPVLAGGDLS